MKQLKQSNRGVLRAKKSEKNYNLALSEPTNILTEIVETFWRVDWDLNNRPTHKQENIPDPCIHIVFEPSGSRIIGAVTKRYSVELAGKGHIFGIKFRPGGFHALTQLQVSSFTDSSLEINDVFTSDGQQLIEQICRAQTIEQMQSIAEAFLLPKMPKSFEDIALLSKIINEIHSNPQIMKVSDLSEQFALSERSLQRLFKWQVGVSPKWAIRKCRIQEVLSQLEDGDHDWQQLVTQLGYFDQSHFIKDFKSLINLTPTQYIKQLRESA